MSTAEAIAEIMQELEHLRYMLDGDADINTQTASDAIYRIIGRLEDATGVEFYPRKRKARNEKTPADRLKIILTNEAGEQERRLIAGLSLELGDGAGLVFCPVAPGAVELSLWNDED